MANQEHRRILRLGVEVWNKWRDENTDVRPDLSGAILAGVDLTEANLGEVDLTRGDLYRADLRLADLSNADLSNADLSKADLLSADLSRANLSEANLSEANLSAVDLSEASLYGADLTEADLNGVDLSWADLSQADFSGADLTGALLSGATLLGTCLDGTDFASARLAETLLCDVDLSEAAGLATAVHDGPSSVAIDTVYRSKGNIPETFLRGCGAPDEFIAFARSLVGRAAEHYSCFISYSPEDDELAHRLHDDLQEHGIRCWLAPKDNKTDGEVTIAISHAFRVPHRLCLILSEASVASQWAYVEAESALEQEQRTGRKIVLPIRTDSAVMGSVDGWVVHLRRTRSIGNFCRWKDSQSYKRALKRLLRDLQAGT